MASLPELFSASCDRFPDRVALRHGTSVITYKALQQRVDELAVNLKERGAHQSSAVAICLPRSFDWVITALAAMQLGAAYVPIDLTWPEQRKKHVLTDSGATILATRSERSETTINNCVCLDPATASISKAVRHAAASPAAASAILPNDSVAYVLYTSGSTGVPKGVEISHSNLAHLIDWHREVFSVTELDRGTHLAALGFDAAGWELWPYLAAGASVTLADDATRSSPDLLQQWILAESVTLAFVPTSLATVLVRMEWPREVALRFLLTGGDTLLTRPRADLPFTLVNNYGLTECTVVSTSGVVTAEEHAAPALGRAIKGTTVYVLGEDGAPVPNGMAGEIYIGGAGVGRGYRNLPELTSQKFLPDTFSALPNARMYRTGDQGLILPDGQLAFCGRRDGQIKVRGQRLELDEVACVLNQHSAVGFAAVVESRNPVAEQELIAYVLPVAGSSPTSFELQRYLASWLPKYMVPTQFVRLTAVPLTTNGKLDRAALEQPTRFNSLAAEDGAEDLTPVAHQLLEIVRKLLGTEDATAKDDFFLIGGHSLLGTQLVLRVRAAFGVDLTLRDLFEAATVEQLALRVEALLIADLEAMSEEDALRLTGE